MNTDIRLYILGRTDIKTMTPGKMMAQVSHAANQCVYDAFMKSDTSNDEELQRAVELENKIINWEEQTGDGFGTTIVLDGKKFGNVIERIEAAKEAGVHAGYMLDPTYPDVRPMYWYEILIRAAFMIIPVLSTVYFMSIGATAIALISAMVFLMEVAMHDNRQHKEKVRKKLVPMVTCAYIFGEQTEVKPFLTGLKLMP